MIIRIVSAPFRMFFQSNLEEDRSWLWQLDNGNILEFGMSADVPYLRIIRRNTTDDLVMWIPRAIADEGGFPPRQTPPLEVDIPFTENGEDILCLEQPPEIYRIGHALLKAEGLGSPLSGTSAIC